MSELADSKKGLANVMDIEALDQFLERIKNIENEEATLREDKATLKEEFKDKIPVADIMKARTAAKAFAKAKTETATMEDIYHVVAAQVSA